MLDIINRLRCRLGLHRWVTAYVHGSCEHQGCRLGCGRERYLPVVAR